MAGPFKMKGSPMQRNFPSAFPKKGDKKETVIGGTTIVGPFTESELAGAKKVGKSGKKGYEGEEYSVQEYKDFMKVHGEDANPNLKPPHSSYASDR